MKTKLVSCVLALTLGCVSAATFAADTPPAAKPAQTTSKPAKGTQKEPAPMVQCAAGAAKQQCCSAKSCGGKVLSNRDQHNCRTKSNGKSWHAANSMTCVNL